MHLRVLLQLVIAFHVCSVQLTITFVIRLHERAQVYQRANPGGYNVRTLFYKVRSFERYVQVDLAVGNRSLIKTPKLTLGDRGQTLCLEPSDPWGKGPLLVDPVQALGSGQKCVHIFAHFGCNYTPSWLKGSKIPFERYWVLRSFDLTFGFLPTPTGTI
jgi:hypothetical protein